MTSPKDNKTQTCSSANCTLFIQGQFLQGLITFQNEEIIDYGDAVSNSFKASYSTNKFFYVATDIPCHMFDQYKYVSSVLNETALSLFLQTGEIVVKIFYVNTNYTVPEPCVEGKCPDGYQCEGTVCVGPGPSTTFATVAPCELDSLSRFGSAFEQVETTISELTTVANQNQPSRILAKDSGSTTTTTQSSDLSDPNKPLLYAIITICVTVIVVALCCGCICIIKMRYRFSTLRINFYSRNPFRRNASPSTVVPNEYAMAPKFGSMKAVDFDKWEIQVTNLIVNKSEKLGSGAFAAVYKGYLKGKNPLLENLTFSLEMAENIGNEVAVKMLHTHSDDLSREELRKEIDFMKTLGYHPHVLNMIGCVSSIYDPLLIVEYCANGDLLTMLRKHKDYVLADGKEDCPAEADFCLEMRDLLSFAWQVSDGMVYLSLKNFIHRDVAARNILITKKMVAKVADFGLCRYTQEALYTTKGGKLPIKWMALEALKLAEFTTKSDVWSYGVLLFELFSLGDNPYPSVQPSDMIDHLLQGNRLEKPDLCPDEMQV
uniref:Protein kinase domain-containing protein n=1 Tax=Panagrolaimus sp. JU765 TaxID=591449 RepID=A0AC34QMY7_9BILA